MTNKDKLQELAGHNLDSQFKQAMRKEDSLDAELEREADAILAAEANQQPATTLPAPKSGSSKGKIVVAGLVVAAAVGGSIAIFGGDVKLPTPVPVTNDCKTPCNDGTCSSSTGPGTCAGHGGILTQESKSDRCTTRCKDGTCSESQGSGACSGHGGVFKIVDTGKCTTRCKDGTCSDSKGSGACSGHGGVFVIKD